MGKRRKKGLFFLLIFISSTLEIVPGKEKNARLVRDINLTSISLKFKAASKPCKRAKNKDRTAMKGR